MDDVTLAEIRAGEAALRRQRPRLASNLAPIPPDDLDEADEISWVAMELELGKRRAARVGRQIQAERTLTEWTATMRQRDEQVRAAVAAGVSVRRVQRITGIARSTITRILSG